MLKHHSKLERNSMLMLLGIIIMVSIGGLVQIIPLFRMETTIEPVKGMRPYTPLELAGYNIYLREGCYNCHSQQIRPLRDEVERYGHYSLAAESMYDHPFQWGSKRTGPDLARVGGKYSDDWQHRHLADPRSVVPESIMPSYSRLMTHAAELDDIGEHLKTLRIVGVPYTDEMVENAYHDAMAQAHNEDSGQDGLKARYGEKTNARDFDGQPNLVSEMDALVAYLQVLGTMADLKDYNMDASQQASADAVASEATATSETPKTPAASEAEAGAEEAPAPAAAEVATEAAPSAEETPAAEATEAAETTVEATPDAAPAATESEAQ